MRRVCCAVPVQTLRSSKRLWTGVNRVLLLAQADLLGRAECLATDAFGNLLNLAAGLEERCDLIVDRFAGSTAGAGFALLVDAFTRMAAINL